VQFLIPNMIAPQHMQVVLKVFVPTTFFFFKELRTIEQRQSKCKHK